jgi:hypothetical protein
MWEFTGASSAGPVWEASCAPVHSNKQGWLHRTRFVPACRGVFNFTTASLQRIPTVPEASPRSSTADRQCRPAVDTVSRTSPSKDRCLARELDRHEKAKGQSSAP